MRYTIRGAQKTDGRETKITLRARSVQDALADANRRGLYVSTVTPVPSRIRPLHVVAISSVIAAATIACAMIFFQNGARPTDVAKVRGSSVSATLMRCAAGSPELEPIKNIQVYLVAVADMRHVDPILDECKQVVKGKSHAVLDIGLKIAASAKRRDEIWTDIRNQLVEMNRFSADRPTARAADQATQAASRASSGFDLLARQRAVEDGLKKEVIDAAERLRTTYGDYKSQLYARLSVVTHHRTSTSDLGKCSFNDVKPGQYILVAFDELSYFRKECNVDRDTNVFLGPDEAVIMVPKATEF